MNDQLNDPSHNAGWSPEGPLLVADHEGRGWYARPHGGLTRREDELLDECAREHYGDEDSVRLVRRGADTEQFGRLTIAGARELSTQLRSAADTAEARRNQRYAQHSVDAEQERQQGESGRYSPENESSLNLLRHYQRDDESLTQALKRLMREGRNMRPWEVVVTISHTPDDAWSARYRIELFPASGRNTFESQNVDDVVAQGPAPQPPSLDVADYDQEKLSEDEMVACSELGVSVALRTTAKSVANARLRRELAMATWDER